MPVPENIITSWAEEVEAENAPNLPPREEILKGTTKIVTEYKFGENDEKIKIVSEYSIEKKLLPKSVAARKKWRKFGQASGDPPGPNPSNMFINSEEIRLQFVRNSAGEYIDTKIDDDPLTKLKSSSMMNCKYCKGIDHFSMKCPYKHMFEEQKMLLEGTTPQQAAANQRERELDEKAKAGTYVPPSLRGGSNVARAGFDMRGGKPEDWTVRVTNLPEDTTDEDLKEMFKQAGRVQRIFLAKDKVTNKSKGFAFITYHERKDAEKAIQVISGHRYDHLILKVEWARPNVT